jgi:3-methyladenine DNA glycosylase AlkD
MAAYVRGQFPFFGIPSAGRAVIERAIVSAHPPPESARDLAGIVLRCWVGPEREYQYFGVACLRRHMALATPDLVPTVRRLVTTKSWWDTVDELATHVVGPLVSAYPELRATIDEWIGSDDLWLARTAILHQERYRERTDPDLLFAYCLRRAADRDFFIRKAIGWALRSYAKTNPLAVETFLGRHGEALSGLSRREAHKGLALARRKAAH